MRFIMIGGFLGAGKTTTVARLARHYLQQGKNVGIVTNDQASDLVDTLSLRAQGFDVGEVAGACFCCNFNDLTETVSELSESQQPDIVIAEPVGSCTDLVATVIQPMLHIYRQENRSREPFELAPFGVIFKPSHGRKILGDGHSGFSPKAAYIFRKQLEEADFAILNHIDDLAEEELRELEELLAANYPETPLVKISAITGEGFEELTGYLERSGDFGRRISDVDYDVYAEGEAELGWLNMSLRLRSTRKTDLDELTLGLVKLICRELPPGAEIAHLKALAVWDGAHAVANLTSSDASPVLSLPADRQTDTADLVINARVAMDPGELAECVSRAVKSCGRLFDAELSTISLKHFRPGRPVPTHRFSEAR